MKTVLLVEDDLVVQTAYRDRLQRERFHVETAADGAEAIKALSSGEPPDIIILDLMMPNINGQEVLKFIRSTASLVKTPVIVLSSTDIIKAFEDAVMDMADKRLLKSTCTFPLMLRAIHDLLQQHENNARQPALSAREILAKPFGSSFANAPI